MMKVLVVEDDRSTLLLLRLLLRQAGCEVVIADDAQSGLQSLKRQRFDWLIVDGQLPPFNGLELSTKAKSLQPDLRIVMVSGVYEAADIEDRPISKLFQKPVDANALISYLRATQ
jgi:CheY-like chemotaxis protein